MTCDVCEKPIGIWSTHRMYTPGRTWRLCRDCATGVSKYILKAQASAKIREDTRKAQIIEEARGEG